MQYKYQLNRLFSAGFQIQLQIVYLLTIHNSRHDVFQLLNAICDSFIQVMPYDLFAVLGRNSDLHEEVNGDGRWRQVKRCYSHHNFSRNMMALRTRAPPPQATYAAVARTMWQEHKGYLLTNGKGWGPCYTPTRVDARLLKI